MAFSIIYIPLSLYAGSLVAKVSARKISGLAMLFACVTGLLFAFTLGGGAASAVIYLVMTAVAYGLFFVPISQYIMSFAGEKDRGNVSACLLTIPADSLTSASVFGPGDASFAFSHYRGRDYADAEGEKAAGVSAVRLSVICCRAVSAAPRAPTIWGLSGTVNSIFSFSLSSLWRHSLYAAPPLKTTFSFGAILRHIAAIRVATAW